MTPRILVLAALVAAIAFPACGHAASTSDVETTPTTAGARPGASHRVVLESLGPRRDAWLAELRDVTPESGWPELAADGIVDLADAHSSLGEFEEADRLYAALERAAIAARLPAILATTGTLMRGSNALDRGAYADAGAFFASVCDAEAEDESHAEQIAAACYLLAHVYAEAGDASVLARIPALAADAPEFAARTRQRAYVLAKAGRTDEAETELRRLVPAFELAALEESVDLRIFGLVQFARGRFDAALEAHRRELAADRRTARADGAALPPTIEADDVAYLVRAGLAARRPELVCGEASTALARVLDEHGDRHPATGLLHLRVAQCARLTGDAATAASESTLALAAFATSAPTHVGRIEAEAFAAEIGAR